MIQNDLGLRKGIQIKTGLVLLRSRLKVLVVLKLLSLFDYLWEEY